MFDHVGESNAIIMDLTLGYNINANGIRVLVQFFMFYFFEKLIMYIELYIWRHGTPSASASGFKGEGQLIARPHAEVK